MGKLFGTDGIRGIVNESLNAELAFEVGCAAAQVLARDSKHAKPLFTISLYTLIVFRHNSIKRTKDRLSQVGLLHTHND